MYYLFPVNHHNHNKAAIIGSGIAGMASAIRLAVLGYEVSVFEKNAYAGGKLHAVESNGFRFDAGPSLFTQPHLLEELFAYANEPIEEYFSYQPVPVSCRYFYEDGTRVTAYADRDRFANELNEKLGEGEDRLHAYLDRSKKMYNDIGSVFLSRSLHKGFSLFNGQTLKALSSARLPYLFNTMHAMNAGHFKNPKTVQLFDRYATYNGSNPYKAPGMLGLIPHIEHNEGVYYPKGGMISITNALYRLALKKGVHFYFDSKVEKIIRHEGQVHGLVVNGENKRFDVVVSNLDPYLTCKHLLNDDSRAHRIAKQERSSSAMVFYWGIGRKFDELDLHNIFFAKDYKAEFDYLFRARKMYGDPTIYINITGKYEPGAHAPQGKENWFVMVNAPANIGQDWGQYRAKYRTAIIDKLSRMLQADIESLIETEEIADPVTIEAQSGSFKGSLYGTSSNTRMAAFLRHPNFSKSIQGMYFAGGSVHPGGGIPLCLQSAAITSGLVEKDREKRKKH